MHYYHKYCRIPILTSRNYLPMGGFLLMPSEVKNPELYTVWWRCGPHILQVTEGMREYTNGIRENGGFHNCRAHWRWYRSENRRKNSIVKNHRDPGFKNLVTQYMIEKVYQEITAGEWTKKYVEKNWSWSILKGAKYLNQFFYGKYNSNFDWFPSYYDQYLTLMRENS